MPEYLAPGVYVEEVSFRSKSIEGVSTSTAAFVGPTRKGPLSGTPEVITSLGDFERVYGGLANLSFDSGTDQDPQLTNYLAHAVNAFFNNGGARLYVARTFMPRTGATPSDGIARSSAVVGANAGNAADQAFFVARGPGSGNNCLILTSMKTSKTSAAQVNNQSAFPVGSVLRTGGTSPARPAQLVGGTPPFRVDDGSQLVLLVNGAQQTITFNGGPAEVTGDAVADPANVAIPANTSLVVTLTGRPAQTIALPAETRTLAAWTAFINERLVFGYARVTAGGDQLAIGSDLRGSGVSASVNALAELGFNPGGGATAVTATGTGNVPNLDALSIADIAGLAPAGQITATAAPTTGQLVLTTVSTGAGATLQVDARHA